MSVIDTGVIEFADVFLVYYFCSDYNDIPIQCRFFACKHFYSTNLIKKN